MRRSVTEYLEHFYRYGSQIATVHRRGYRTIRWSYRRIAETACQLARELEARKVERGDRVLLWGENCAEWVAAFWGCLLRGAVVVPMDNIASPDFALRVLRQVDAKLIVCPREKAGLEPAIPALTFETLAETVANHDRSLYPARVDRADLAEIIFTSGTTAEPKGVVISHGNLLANLEPLEDGIHEYRKYEWLVHPLRFLELVPLSHVFGQFMAIFVPPLLCGTVIFQDSLNPSEIVRAIKKGRISVLVAVPRLLQSLRDKLERGWEAEGKLDQFREELQAAANEKFFRRWWRFRRIHNNFGWKFWAFVSGGATLDQDVEAFWSRLGFFVIQGYGLTETTSLVSLNHPFRLSKGSIGQALPGREIKLDPSGEILVRGESIARGYWTGRELQPTVGEEGWFRTGDLGAFDEKGNLFFKGRKKNVIVTSEGMNIYPEDLEAALRRQPEVRDAVVVEVKRNGREEPCAVLLLRQEAGRDRPPGLSSDALAKEGLYQDRPGGLSLPAEAIVQRANQSLAEYQRMRCWYVWQGEDFPRTATQKPRLAEILDTVAKQLSGEPGAGAPGSTAGQPELADLIRRITGRRPAGFSPNARLEEDLNLTSIDRVELMSAIEDRYQIDLNETTFASAATVSDLEKVLHESAPQRSDYPYPRWPQQPLVELIRVAVYYLLTWPTTVLLAWPRVRGRENLRGLQGPVLVVCNHVTPIDIGWVLFALPARFRHRLAIAMGGERLRALRHPSPDLHWGSPGYRGHWLRRLLDRLSYILVVALFNVFPLPKQSGVRESFQFAGELLDKSYSVLVFPEGELTKDGNVAPFRTGIGVLASKLSVPIIPMRIDGLFELREANRKIALPGQVKVTIGAPVRFAPDTDPAAIARELQTLVQSLS